MRFRGNSCRARTLARSVRQHRPRSRRQRRSPILPSPQAPRSPPPWRRPPRPRRRTRFWAARRFQPGRDEARRASRPEREDPRRPARRSTRRGWLSSDLGYRPGPGWGPRVPRSRWPFAAFRSAGRPQPGSVRDFEPPARAPHVRAASGSTRRGGRARGVGGWPLHRSTRTCAPRPGRARWDRRRSAGKGEPCRSPPPNRR